MKLLLIGAGVVGRAFIQRLADDAGELYRAHGLSPKLVGVVDSRGAAVCERGLDPNALLSAKRDHGTVSATPQHGTSQVDVDALIADGGADTIIEATPTVLAAPKAAMDHLRFAMRAGRHVVTVNKAPLATAMPALFELAAYNKVQFRFSGTVGGGTPVLALARECARGDRIERIRAVLNGTTNFILSRMHEQRESFEAALSEAVRLGYAETDPSADIDGVDTATKAVILSNWVMGRPATIQDVTIEGIRGISREPIAKAEQSGRRVKLIAEIDGGIRVSPGEVEISSPLDVPANLNAITLSLRNSGDVTLIGRGAGGAETATAILRDVLDIWQIMGGRA